MAQRSVTPSGVSIQTGGGEVRQLAPGGAVPGGRLLPAGLDAAVAPDGDGTEPHGHERADDPEARGVEVETTGEAPEPAAELQLPGQHLTQLERADEERDQDRQSGDRDVVVD